MIWSHALCVYVKAFGIEMKSNLILLIVPQCYHNLSLIGVKIYSGNALVIGGINSITMTS